MRVSFVVPYPPGRAGGQRFRFEQWLRLLPDGAVDADLRPLFTPAAYDRLYRPGGTIRKVGDTLGGLAGRLVDVAAVGASDVVFVYREAFALGPALLERILARRPLVFDFDDAIFLGDTSAANRAVAALKAPGKTATIVRVATTTTVGNDYLAAYARGHSSHVEVIPTTLDVDTYRPVPRPPNPRFVVGWSGSPTTAVHLRTIEPALRELAAAGMEVRVVGAPDFTLAGAANVAARPWRRATEIADVSAFDVGLMPLPDDEWSRGKCGFKALLYMALGVPVVASPVGVNTDIVRHGVNGLLAGPPDEWVAAVRTLAEDPALRRRLADAGRQTVVERYSGQRWAPRFLAVLEEAASRGHSR